MTIKETAKALGCELLHDSFKDTQIEGAYTSDLLSDVIANAKSGGALITIQAHKNTIAVASLATISAIIICNKRPIPDDMLEAAKEEGVALLRSEENQFTVSGRLYAMLHAA